MVDRSDAADGAGEDKLRKIVEGWADDGKPEQSAFEPVGAMQKSLGQCLREAIPAGPHIVERIRLTRAEFAAMPVATAADNLPVGPYTPCKVLLGGKWHACDRQYQFGVQVHFARPIVVVCK